MSPGAFPGGSDTVKSLPAMQEMQVPSLDQEDILEKGIAMHSRAFLVAQTDSTYNAGDLGSIPGSGRSPGEGNGNPL